MVTIINKQLLTLTRIQDIQLSYYYSNKLENLRKKDRTVFRPVISTDVMGNRNVEARAVEAWIQPVYVYGHVQNIVHEAMNSADIIEKQMLDTRNEKEEKLRLFQAKVRRRVNTHYLAQKQEIHEKSCKQQIECEKRLLHESEKIHGAMYSEVMVNKVFNNHCIGPHAPKVELKGGLNKEHIDIANNARLKLCQKQIMTKEYGRIHNSYTQDMISSPHKGVVADEEHIDNIQQIPDEQSAKSVTFRRDDSQPNKTKAYKKDASHQSSAVITPGYHDNNQSVAKQVALCRRIFSDVEREKVKEAHRVKEHRLKIAKLKEAKELERLTEEGISAQLVEPVDPLRGESEAEIIERERLYEKISAEMIQSTNDRIQKLREMERFVEALKQRVKEKSERRGVDIPPLCCCSDSVWMASPYTCANNCVFYQNPKEFSKVLESLLKSLDMNR